MWVKLAYNNCKGPAVYASLKNGIHTSCMLSPEKYVPYCAAWLNADAGALAVFRSGGALSQDSAWRNYASKVL